MTVDINANDVSPYKVPFKRKRDLLVGVDDDGGRRWGRFVAFNEASVFKMRFWVDALVICYREFIIFSWEK